MPERIGISFTEFPPFDAQADPATDSHDSPFEFDFEDHFEEAYNSTKPNMAGNGSPYIKSESNDFFNFNQFSPAQPSNGFDMNNTHNFNGVDPSQLANGGQMYGQNSFNSGNAGIADDELENLAGSLDTNQGQMRNQAFFGASSHGGSMPMTMGQQNMNIYSSTPGGDPIQSPFLNDHGFNYGQFRSPNQQSRSMNLGQSAGLANSVMRTQHIHSMERKISEGRGPASPHTPGLNNLHIGEPEFPMGQQQMMNRASTSVGNDWSQSAGQSWNENSPYPSPSNAPHQMHHAQISEVLRTEDVKVKPEPSNGNPGYHSVEAKRRRRRESHNLVERRRRDNINERIQDMANLVPQHRLEDEKVRKHLQTNSPLSPSITATSMSPPNPSMLSTSAGGRTGAITQGLPMDDKDKGPNKGDILNSSVSWTRDVMWFLHKQLNEEAHLMELLKSNGIDWPFHKTDEEIRMRSEIKEVIDRNLRANNVQPYSRAHGSGLRVPGFTNIAGDALSGSENGQSLSPGMNVGAQQQNWRSASVFKEEDEFDDMLN